LVVRRRTDTTAELDALLDPARSEQSKVAVAESADLVGFLIGPDKRSRFAVSVAELRRGEGIEAAVRVGYGSNLALLERKWTRELDYRLIKEVWAFDGNRIGVRFAYEWHDDSGSWFRSYGNENWEFDAHGLMRVRIASINDLPLAESDRKYHWPLGRRPDGHPTLSELGL
jgi:nuclear transport factor 2 (NTF2) superfamily protein